MEGHGFRHAVDLPGMAAERVAPPCRELPRLDVRRVGAGVGREQFAGISSACFNAPSRWFREVFDGAGVWNEFAAYVGYMGGEPVAIAAIVADSGAAGVYNLGVLPEARRRGYGEAMMRHALDEARRRYGVERSVLQSTPAGLRLY